MGDIKSLRNCRIKSYVTVHTVLSACSEFQIFLSLTGTTDRKHEIKKIPPERPECLPNRTEEKGMKCAFLPVLCRETREIEPVHTLIAHSLFPLSVLFGCSFSTLIDCDDRHFGKALVVAYGLNSWCSVECMQPQLKSRGDLLSIHEMLYKAQCSIKPRCSTE